MWVWNQNQMTELDNGYGAKDVTIETSTDGTTWTALADVPEFAQATGEPNYVHNTTVDFGGVLAKYVRLTIKSNWGGRQADRPERGAVLLHPGANLLICDRRSGLAEPRRADKGWQFIRLPALSLSVGPTSWYHHVLLCSEIPEA